MLNLNFPVAVSHPKDFYDRRDIIARVQSVLKSPNPQSIIIRGERRIGKTSLLNIIAHHLTQWQPSAVQVRLPHGDNIRSFNIFAKEILYKLSLELNKDFESTRTKNGDVTFASVGQLVDEIMRLTFPHTITTVLFIDEFDATLANCSPADAGKILATLNYLQEKTDLPFVTVLTTTAHYPDVKNADFVDLKPFSESDTVAMILDLAGDDITFSEAALARLFYFSGGHPFLVKGILRRLWLVYADEMHITPTMVDRAVEFAATDATVDAALKNIYRVHFSAAEKYIMLQLSAQNKVNRQMYAAPQFITATNQLMRRNYIAAKDENVLTFCSNFWQVWLQNMDEYHDELTLLGVQT